MSETYNNFVFYKEWLDQLKVIAMGGTPEDLISLCDGLQEFLNGEELGEITPLARLLFNQMTAQIARDKGTYKEISEKRSEAGQKGADARWGKAKDGKPMANDGKTWQTMANDGEEEEEEVEVEVSTNVDDIHTVSERELRDEFELIWAKYPRKVGKKDAFRHYKAARKKGTVFDEVYNGVMKYADAMAAEDEQYIAQGSTWFNGHRWEDEDVHARARPQKHLTMAEISSLPIIDPFAELRGAT